MASATQVVLPLFCQFLQFSLWTVVCNQRFMQSVLKPGVGAHHTLHRISEGLKRDIVVEGMCSISDVNLEAKEEFSTFRVVCYVIVITLFELNSSAVQICLPDESSNSCSAPLTAHHFDCHAKLHYLKQVRSHGRNCRPEQILLIFITNSLLCC